MAKHRHRPTTTARPSTPLKVHPMVAKAVGLPTPDRHALATDPSVVPPVALGDPAGIFVLLLGALLMVVLTPVIALWVPTTGAGSFWGSLLAVVVFTNGAGLAGSGARLLDGQDL